ncbi:MAG: hypothetical protein JWO03_1484 [Bacteroidetes bacterium]|nr:hypothetical protein [Bacteroidota bacterium]
MKNLKIFVCILAMTAFAAVRSVQAQTDSMGGMNANGHMGSSGMNSYLLIGSLVLIGIIGGIVVMRRKKGDNRPQSGADINNPASGI